MPVRADVACKALPRVCNPLRNGSFSPAFDKCSQRGSRFCLSSPAVETSSGPSRRVDENLRTSQRRIPAPHKLALVPAAAGVERPSRPVARALAPQSINQAREPSALTGARTPESGGCRHTALGCPKRLGGAATNHGAIRKNETLEGPRAARHGRRRVDQEGLPQVSVNVPPRPQPDERRGSHGTLQADQRGEYLLDLCRW